MAGAVDHEKTQDRYRCVVQRVKHAAIGAGGELGGCIRRARHCMVWTRVGLFQGTRQQDPLATLFGGGGQEIYRTGEIGGERG